MRRVSELRKLLGAQGLFHRLHVRLGMRFDDPSKENAFFDQFCLSRAALSQLYIFGGGIIFYAFFIWDEIIDPAHGQTTHLIRGLCVTPLVWLCASVLRLKPFYRFHEWLLAVPVLLCSLMLSFIYTLLGNGFDYGAAGVVLVLVFMFSLLQMRYTYHLTVTALSWSVFDGLELVARNAKPGMFVVNNLTLGTASFLGIFSILMREWSARQQFTLGLQLEQSKVRVDELLYSMLPREIVTRIQAGETTIADSYSEVSIVFADLVGFTELARRVSAGHLVEILNDIFTEFDRLADAFGVEKIKTIGDAYMAVGGISEARDQRDHVERAAGFAFALQQCVGVLSERVRQPINIRIGLHVGPIVAGVVGVKRPAFDCWGEAVNLASRLEHSAIPGGILISESAYWRLQATHIIDGLSEIELKGIGPSKVFLLKGRVEPEARAVLH